MEIARDKKRVSDTERNDAKVSGWGEGKGPGHRHALARMNAGRVTTGQNRRKGKRRDPARQREGRGKENRTASAYRLCRKENARAKTRRGQGKRGGVSKESWLRPWGEQPDKVLRKHRRKKLASG
jgi:hypothetical protein